jgi:hypothetical protein
MRAYRGDVPERQRLARWGYDVAGVNPGSCSYLVVLRDSERLPAVVEAGTERELSSRAMSDDGGRQLSSRAGGWLNSYVMNSLLSIL